MTCNFHCLLEEQKHHWIIFTATKEIRNNTGNKLYTAIRAVKLSNSINDLLSFRKSVFPSLAWISEYALASLHATKRTGKFFWRPWAWSQWCTGINHQYLHYNHWSLVVGFSKLTKLHWHLLNHPALTPMICPTEIPADVIARVEQSSPITGDEKNVTLLRQKFVGNPLKTLKSSQCLCAVINIIPGDPQGM